MSESENPKPRAKRPRKPTPGEVESNRLRTLLSKANGGVLVGDPVDTVEHLINTNVTLSRKLHAVTVQLEALTTLVRG